VFREVLYSIWRTSRSTCASDKGGMNGVCVCGREVMFILCANFEEKGVKV